MVCRKSTSPFRLQHPRKQCPAVLVLSHQCFDVLHHQNISQPNFDTKWIADCCHYELRPWRVVHVVPHTEQFLHQLRPLVAQSLLHSSATHSLAAQGSTHMSVLVSRCCQAWQGNPATRAGAAKASGVDGQYSPTSLAIGATGKLPSCILERRVDWQSLSISTSISMRNLKSEDPYLWNGFVSRHCERKATSESLTYWIGRNHLTVVHSPNEILQLPTKLPPTKSESVACTQTVKTRETERHFILTAGHPSNAWLRVHQRCARHPSTPGETWTLCKTTSKIGKQSARIESLHVWQKLFLLI